MLSIIWQLLIMIYFFIILEDGPQAALVVILLMVGKFVHIIMQNDVRYILLIFFKL